MKFKILLLIAVCALAVAAEEPAAKPSALEVGMTAPEWDAGQWLNSKPLELKSLRGKVVLIRWWTAPGCPYCRATAPALNEFYSSYHDKGLEVVGLYHHKQTTPLSVDEVKKHADSFGFKFPVAIDPKWQTLNRWWLAGDSKDKWTSVSFLLDKEGVVRHIHPGGQYVKGDGKYEELAAKIVELLANDKK